MNTTPLRPADLTHPIIAALVSVIVNYGGTFILVFQGAKVAGLSPEQTASWIWSISIGVGLTGAWLSFRYREPIITAWSTPGAAFLIAVLPNTPYAEMIGAYMLSAIGFIVLGASGYFERVVKMIPPGIAAGLLAGILLRFGIGAFGGAGMDPLLVGGLILTYALLRRFTARYAIVGVLIAGIALLLGMGQVSFGSVALELAMPVFTAPAFSMTALLSVAFPLFVITLTGQYMPGMLVLRNDGFKTSANPILTVTGFGSLLMAPFGSHAFNVAAITAAICTGKESHEDAKKRYIAGLACGVFYILVGVFGTTLAALFVVLPPTFITTLAGLALLGAIGGSLATALVDLRGRETALITFLATAANITLFGLGGAFWGLAAGLIAHGLIHGDLRMSRWFPRLSRSISPPPTGENTLNPPAEIQQPIAPLAANTPQAHASGPLAVADPEVARHVLREHERQRHSIELIASENIVSRAVLDMQGSVLTNKYAEGYPGRRYYGGCAHVDAIELLAIERAKALFGCTYANVQPHSGSQANQAVYLALLKPGDTLLGLGLAAGGHLTHGAPMNISGKWFRAIAYGVRPDDHRVDMQEVERLAREYRPRLIIAGGSAYARILDFAEFRRIADAVGALLMVDMAHFAGLVAGGAHPSPFPHAHVVTSTTHKTLRGPRGGLILGNDPELGKAINSAIFPGLQGGPLMHVIGAKAVAFGEALQPAFGIYAHRVAENAKVLAETLAAGGLPIVSGGTDTHLAVADLRPLKLTGNVAEKALERVGITLNKNAIPNDPEKPMITSGIRVGSPSGTSRGFGPAEFQSIGGMILSVLEAVARQPDCPDDAVMKAAQDAVADLCRRFPLPY